MTTTVYTADPTPLPRAEHAEGPAWDARYSMLLWVDQFAGLVHLASAQEGQAVELARTYDVGTPVGAVVPLLERGLGWMIAAGEGFAHLGEDGVVTAVASPLAGQTHRLRMNDGTCDPSGRFWAGSMAWEKTAGSGALYRLDLDGSCATVITRVTISNGMAWNGDGGLAYYIDSPTQRVDVLAVAPDGAVLGRRTAFPIDASAGTPDGMTIDDEGCLWVALWGGSAVHRYSPEGQLLGIVDVDAPQVSSCAFGGPDRDVLFITTSQEGYSPAQSDEHPLAGRVFRAKVDVTGPSAAPFRGGLPVVG
ncbi:SMP-30/gluconolactonase/LRE family protein [Naasia sp. SYSU D00948]|uniref:SMP-30/gluconolactonase/LRE family protein n=1 Tax=Naasia sp. SYSU D00948 TaxID=2817379 RepID=UPI001B3179B4|nr:SMP-30/gluconolactonase/LRE family protein [Naasia sp. SYSU D00948]